LTRACRQSAPNQFHPVPKRALARLCNRVQPHFLPRREEILEVPTDGLQPIYKLHGSSRWLTSSAGTPILIIGGEKSRAIGQFEVLEHYAKRFDWWLNQGTRLMVIGYGFRDLHINSAPRRAEPSGLQLFVVDPNGPEALVRNAGMESLVKTRLIGASRRPIRETLARDPAERAKLMRFFDV
jgi:hypothetical protein